MKKMYNEEFRGVYFLTIREKTLNQISYSNRPFPSSPGPPYENEVRCSTFDMEMIFHSHANKNHFHKKS